jgi:hypothetical protein
VANLIYPKFKLNHATAAGFDWLNHDIRALCIRTGGARNTAHEFVSDVIAGGFEVQSGYGYSRQLVTGRTKVLVGESLECRGGNSNFGSAIASGAGSIIAVVYYRFVTGDSDSPVINWNDAGGSPNDLPFATDGGPFEIQPPGGVILTL